MGNAKELREFYQVNEIFDSIQGEGVLVGTPSTFIRLQGCTVGCSWCDTKYTWAAGGERLSVDKIVQQVTKHHVIITGGEPIAYNLDGLFIALRKSDHFISLETSGQGDFKGDFRPNWITLSPKEALDFQAPVELWGMADEVKWVVDEALDWLTVWDQWIEIQTYREEPPFFVLMPEGCPTTPTLARKTLDWLDLLDGQWRKTKRHYRYGDDLKYRSWNPFKSFRFGDRLQYRIGVP